jgi:iron complex outermembrane recepter protein
MLPQWIASIDGPPSRVRLAVVVALFFTSALLPSPLAGQDAAALKRLALEDLMDVDVTSVSRRSEPVSEAAAAVDVITGDEIRRSGITSIAEVLRLATGLSVARVDGTTWALSARGFTGTAANKLLVLMDGRSVYTPLFSGVFWDIQDTLLADVERIEVIRGPGATLWGANAVNGVINIITRPASRTQGGRIEVATGNEERGLASIRYGDQLGRSAHYRAYTKLNYQDAQRSESGASAGDPLRRIQLGGRIDWRVSSKTQVAVIGDANAGGMGRVDRPTTDVRDGNILARVRHELSPGAELQVQAYYDRTFRSIPGLFEEDRGTWDLDVQYRARARGRHMLLAGGGYRLSRDRTGVPPPPDGSRPTGSIVFVPASRQSPLLAAFVQDDVTLVPRTLTLTVGARAEHNDFSGFEFQPTIRARWIPRPRTVVWSAVSRAVRTPTRLDVDVRSLLPDGRVVAVGGGNSFEAESVVAYEFGYRVQPIASVSVDVAAYHNEYDRLRSQEPGPPITLANGLRGRTNGLETQVTLWPTSWMRWQGSWTLFDKHLERRPGSADPTAGAAEGDDPRHQLGIRAAVNLPHRTELEAFLRRVGELPSPTVPAYTELDLRTSWALTDDLELALVGRNLLHASHPEFGAPGPRRVDLERSLYIRARVSF